MPERYAIIAMIGACALDRSGMLGVEVTTTGTGGAAASSSTGGAIASSTSTSASGGAGGAPNGSGGGGGAPLDCTSGDLIACYRFEGDLLDGSGNNHHLAPQGTVQYMPGVEGQSVRIAGDTVLLAAFTNSWVSTSLTVEMWIRPQSIPSDRAALLDNACCYSVFLYDDGSLRCNVGAESVYGGNVVPNTWTHVACVHDGTSLRAYVGGMLVGSVNSAPLTPVNTSTAIGVNVPELDSRFDGDVDSVRVWSVPLSDQQICEAAGC
jgi:concanavalin A-like lectin/glucanase superfamily protein